MHVAPRGRSRTRDVKEVLVAQYYLCLAAQVALHLVLAQLVSEVVCVCILR